MADFIDQPETIRRGEELNESALVEYLKGQLDLPADQTIDIRQYPSGHSNLTYSVQIGEEQYVLRRPPFGSKVKSAHDMGREYRVLSKLHTVYPLAPEPILFCGDEAVTGAQFYVMRKLSGIVLRKELPSGLELSPQSAAQLNRNLIESLAKLHQVDYEAAGLGDLGKPDGYVERQVTGWTRRYHDAKTDEIPSVQKIADWLASELPAESGAGLIHNDYKLDNVVLDPEDPTKIIGVLDWEMSTLGDPLMDLGTTLSYWVSSDDDPSHQMIRWGPTDVPGSLSRQELAEHYSTKTGYDVSNILYYYCFGLFKTAVVLQQIYYRYKKGLTQDERFASLIMGVSVLTDTAVRAVENDRM